MVAHGDHLGAVRPDVICSTSLGAFIYLITERIARRLGWLGLAVVVNVAAILGLSPDDWHMEVSGVGRPWAEGCTHPGDTNTEPPSHLQIRFSMRLA